MVRGVGPDMSPFLFTDAILHNRPIKVFNNGDMLRDFTYIDDIVEGVLRVVDSVPRPIRFGIRRSPIRVLLQLLIKFIISAILFL